MKYFPTEAYGSTENDTPPPRVVLIALVKLFDNNYLVGRSDIGCRYTVRKATTNEKLRKWLKAKNNR